MVDLDEKFEETRCAEGVENAGLSSSGWVFDRILSLIFDLLKETTKVRNSLVELPRT